MRVSVSNLSRWASIVLSLAFWAVGFIHLVAWFFIVFIYHANAVPAVRIEFLPIYGRLGVLGVWIFLVTVLLDFAAAVMLMSGTRHHQAWATAVGLLNLPIIPLGSAIGLATIMIIVHGSRN
jgi:hypothetical protein